MYVVPGQPAACRLRHGDQVGAAFRFPKGHVPANKGLRRPGWTAGRMADTQFKPGQRGGRWMPLGSVRINSYGYRDRKIADTGYPPRDWRADHLLLWEELLGPVPPGQCVCFKNGDKTDVRIDNLQLLSRAERMRRNSFRTNYPPRSLASSRPAARSSVPSTGEPDVKHKSQDLRNHLFEVIEGLKDEEKPPDIARAKAVADVAGKIIDLARVEVDLLKVTRARQGSDFIPHEPSTGPRRLGN